MKASDILNQWRAVQPVLRNRGGWFSLLVIAEAGPQGILRSKLQEIAGKGAVWSHVVKRWEAAGLITTSRQRAQGCCGGMPALRLHITEKGMRLLRLEPEQP